MSSGDERWATMSGEWRVRGWLIREAQTGESAPLTAGQCPAAVPVTVTVTVRHSAPLCLTPAAVSRSARCCCHSCYRRTLPVAAC